MTDDIVTRLRNNFATKDYPMLKDHCHSCAIPKEWGGHHDNCLYDQAADEIERLSNDLEECRIEYQKLWHKYARALK